MGKRLRKITIYTGLMMDDLPYSSSSRVAKVCDEVVKKAMFRYPIFKNDSYGFKYDNGSGKLTLVFKALWVNQNIPDDYSDHGLDDLTSQVLLWFGDYIFDKLTDYSDFSIGQFYTVFETK